MLEHVGERLQDLEAALAIAPDWLPALLNLGNLHEDMGRREAAAEVYAQVLAEFRAKL